MRALDESKVDLSALNPTHFVHGDFTVRTTTQNVCSGDLLVVDLVEVHLEAFDAVEELAATEGAVTVADVAAELMVCLVTVAVGSEAFDDDWAVGEVRRADVAAARCGG